MNDNPEISIIIVNWNTKDLLMQCLEPLQGRGFEIIVVDNDSRDGSVEACGELFPNVVLIRNAENMGFSKANNIGAEHATGSYLFFLNSDTIPTASAVHKLRCALDENPADIAGARLVSPDGRVDFASARPVPRPMYEFLRTIDINGRFASKCYGIENYEISQKVECVSGAAMMMTRQAFDIVCGWPEDRFMYGDDTEICMKALNRGLTVYYVADAIIVHLGGGSTRSSLMLRFRNSWVQFRSQNRLIRKHYGLLASLVHAPQYPVRLLVWLLGKLLRTGKPLSGK